MPPGIEAVASHVVDAALKIHRAVGPGLLESAYEACLVHELVNRRLSVARQVAVPVIYEGMRVETGFRLDLLVEDLVIVEIKAVEKELPIHLAQLMTYLRFAEKRLGFLINFNVPVIRNGIRRVAL